MWNYKIQDFVVISIIINFPPFSRRFCVAPNSMLQYLVQEDQRTREVTLELLVGCYR